MLTTPGAYDDALERFHRTGPEFDGYLSNHGPMVVEVLARRGQEPLIDRWTDRYLRRLDDLPRGGRPIDPKRWQDALGEAESAPRIDELAHALGYWAARWQPTPSIAAAPEHHS